MFLFSRIISDSLVFSSAAFSFHLDEIIVRTELIHPDSITMLGRRGIALIGIRWANVDEEREYF